MAAPTPSRVFAETKRTTSNVPRASTHGHGGGKTSPHTDYHISGNACGVRLGYLSRDDEAASLTLLAFLVWLFVCRLRLQVFSIPSCREKSFFFLILR
jgi:hypothetical protein